MKYVTAPLLFALRLIAVLLGVLVLVAVVAFVLVGYTGFGANFAVQQVTKRIASPDFAVHVGRVSAPLTGYFTVESVTVSDSEGPYVDVQDIVLDWSPLALFSGKFSAENLTAQSIEMKRLPAPGPEKADTATKESGPFSLPIGIEISHFGFPAIDIGAPVLGEDYPLSAEGHVDAVKDRISVALDATHRARPNTYVKATVDYAPADNRMDISAEVNEPEGGIVATLIKLPGAPALNIKLDGNGPLSDWSGTLTAALSGDTLGTIDIDHQLDADGNRTVALSGSGQFAPLAPEDFRSLVEGTTNLDVSATLAPSGRVAINRGTVTTGGFSLQASGAYDPKGTNDLTATLAATDEPVPFAWPLGEDQLSLAMTSAAVTLSGDAQNADITASAKLARLTVPQADVSDVALDVKGTGFNITERSGTLDTTLSVGGIVLDNEAISPFVRAPVTIKAPVTLAGSQITLDKATLESGAIGGTVDLAYDTADGGLNGHAKLFLAPDALPTAAANMISGTTRVESDFALAAGGAISLSGLEVENDLVNASGDVALSDGSLDASLKAVVADLARLAPQVSGKAELSLDAKGDVTKPDIDAKVTADALQITGETLENFVLTLSGKADMAAPEATLSASGNYAGQPLTLAADVASSDGAIAISGIDGKVGANTLSGDLTLNGEFLPAGGISFDFPDLKLLAGLAGQQASGSLKGRVELDNDGGKLGLSLDASSDRLGFATVSAENLDADVTVADIAELKASGKIAVGTLNASGQSVSNIALTARNDGNSTTFDLAARYQDKPIEAEAVVTRGDTIEIDLQRLSGSPMAVDLRLAQPGHVSIANGTANLSNIRLGIGGGTVSASGSVGNTLNLAIDINGVSAAVANLFVPSLGAEGTVSGTVRTSGSLANPAADYDLTWNNGNLAQNRQLGGPSFTLSASGRYDGNQVTTDATMNNGSGMTVTANGSVGLTGNMPLDLAVRGQLPLSMVSAAAANAGFVLSGSATGDITVGGSAKSPQLSGGVDVNITSLTDIRRGITLNDIRGRVALAGDRVTIDGITGRLSGGGTITIKGNVGITGDFPAALQVVADNAVINDGTLLSTTVNGTLSLDGPVLGSPRLSGRLALGRTAITIPERLPASISDINIVHENASAAVLAQAKALAPQETTGARSSIALDITIDAPNAIFVRGRGVDAELGGSIRVAGTTQNPVVSGGFDLIRGRLSLLNRRLDFSRGRITFGGALVPIIDLQAQTSAGSTAISITLEGVASDPQVQLSSTPPLPQDEILAQLLFNQSSSRLSALQIAQLADAVLQLTGGTDQSLFSAVRNALGIDNLDLSTDDAGNTSVSVGKYLNNNTYVEVEQSRDTGTQANINIDIGRNFILKGSAGSRGETSGGIFYEREY
ncbi:translocation/assembly module TamB domain-containing protein [Martelella endophytica]|uniref:Translocation and assembly module TamB C-terminal domain-containing protein n=1 Tax=Martelella endophytica TaxID=1486262 RepID=A0A0D5LNF2_MAREN|nr:translocation/assembly module TamB domain-containing protein [Martelella endophytica]AJY45754.1 hypothetical protein TM49_08755 [Martelella endophytica]